MHISVGIDDFVAIRQEFGTVGCAMMRINPQQLSPLAQRRIKMFYLSGIRTNGVGSIILKVLQEYRAQLKEPPLPYLKLSTSQCKGPDGQYRQRPVYVTPHYCGQEILVQLQEMQDTELVKWKMLATTGDGASIREPPTRLTQKQLLHRPYFGLAGILNLPQTVKRVEPIIMTPERRKLGEELYKLFLNTSSITLTN